MSSDVVGVWDVPLSDGLHTIEFEHGTASGKRVIRVDNEVIFRNEWMFKLVGDQDFKIGDIPCKVRIEPVSGFSYSYSLIVNGKTLEEFTRRRNKRACTWTIGGNHRIVLEKDTLDIWVDGQKVDATGEFVDGGTETHFTVGDGSAYIKAMSGTNRKEGIVYTLVYNNEIVPLECESNNDEQ
ncbi:Fas apoptotic inhibitory molecule [Nesidiocoris tenuis]|uniref:Fas apoptotic inhibitory molecule n=1 Tax=Nesidiocoris tenuis TaxID=355587 RepID=A0ABN7AT60_9HEMI|nr:Fas apoptotic inhibitory molecule [Nesidiocoris tenuis]